MKQFFSIIMIGCMTSCLMHISLTKYSSTQSKLFNFKDNQYNIEIVKDNKSKIYPFLFVEKSGKKNIWSVTASFTTPQTEIKSISTDLTIKNQKGEIIFEGTEREVELIAFEGYNAKGFDFGNFERDLQLGKQDTLIATYRVNFVSKSFSSYIDTSYLFLNQEKRTGSFF